MYHYTLLISEVSSQELEIGVKELSSIISGRDFYLGFSINWHPILQECLDITLEPDTRYHERQNKKSHHQGKKPEASKANSSHHQNHSGSSQKKQKNCQKRDMPHSSLLNKDFKLMNSEKERRIKEGLCTYCGGKHSP
ncbi:hypothetical protein O181_069382 [Austropuccinia psidii MF-1]|uniref:Uncharacterized protein n=1 Tax=Austropuccinia psidii MF-1 TaxID=1389203 RepID=A0A9Q3F463_9BASI|nr:hypothetical protein [Austropuccinia psidii MF-1]